MRLVLLRTSCFYVGYVQALSVPSLYIVEWYDDGRVLRRLVVGSSPGHVIWDLWWTKWHWGRFSPSTERSPANSHSTDCSTLIIYHPGWCNRPVSGRRTKWTQSHLTTRNWKINVMMNWKGFGRKRSWSNLGTMLEFSWRYWGKRQKKRDWIACVPADIRIRYPQNKNIQRCHYFLLTPLLSTSPLKALSYFLTFLK
jgi:hypothetical protein